MRNMHVRHGIRQIAVIALVALAMTACSKKEEAPPPSPVATAAPAASAPAAPVIATGEANAPGLRVEINELRRTGNDMVTLKMTFINDRQEGVSQFLYTAGLLDLVDKKRYGPVSKGGTSDCMCSDPVASVPAHGRVSAWIRFPAPPDTVQKVGIDFAGFQPIDDVVIRQ